MSKKKKKKKKCEEHEKWYAKEKVGYYRKRERWRGDINELLLQGFIIFTPLHQLTL
jgi:hypothetical protein